MRMHHAWLTAGGLAVALAITMPAMATAAAGTTAAGRTAAGGTTAAGGRTTAVTRSLTVRADAARAARARAAAAAALPRLSVQQLAGQRVIYSYPGLTPPSSLISLIQHGAAAGVIFFGQNISSTAQITSVIRQLEAANASSLNPVRAPLLLMTDQEGGEVRRLPGRPYLSEKQIGANPLPAAQTLATEAGQGAAASLHGVGMNVNLAPVLDVYRQAGDFDDQFGRSYSMNPAVVSSLGSNMITAQQAGGVAATAKHFPGLGAAAASQNTDAGPVTLNLSLATIRSIDEVPFQGAIKAGVKLIMASWAVYPSIGARPAGLSPNAIQGELRNRLKFTGVTITDALEAGALRSYGSIQNRALFAAMAGMDLLLCSAQNVTEGEQASGELATAYSHGTLNGPAFLASVSRVVALREGSK